MKPEPPADLWAQMDAICAKHNMAVIAEKAPDMLTASDFARRYNISPSSASTRMRKLLADGAIELVGTGLCGAKYYRIKK